MYHIYKTFCSLYPVHCTLYSWNIRRIFEGEEVGKCVPVVEHIALIFYFLHSKCTQCTQYIWMGDTHTFMYFVVCVLRALDLRFGLCEDEPNDNNITHMYNSALRMEVGSSYKTQNSSRISYLVQLVVRTTHLPHTHYTTYRIHA